MKTNDLKILMFFHAGSRNRGCEAIIRTAAAVLKQHTRVAKLALASGDPESDRKVPQVDVLHWDQRGTVEKFSPYGFLSMLKVKLFKDESMAFRKMHESIIKLIPQYDVFLSIGGDNYCYGEQPGIYEIDRQIKKAGKKLVLWGASIGAQDLSGDKIGDLKTFDLLLVRESLTQQVLAEAGIPNVQRVADGAFLMEKTELPLPQNWQHGNTLGFNLSPLVLKKNPAAEEAAHRLIQHILDTTDMTICFTPHVILPGNDDYETLKELQEMFADTGRTILLPPDLDATELKGYIARMRFFIGARTHATIAAYSSLVPTMVLGYSIKSKGIAKDLFGEEKLVLNIDEISDAEKLIAAFEQMQSEEAALRQTLTTRIPEIRKMAEKAAEHVLNLL